MHVYETANLVRERERTASPYVEFFRVPAMSGGIYVLAKAATDRQSPHSEDEVYVVVQGRARIRVGADDRAVGPGTIVFVPARLAHRFHDIEESLTALVFFAPAESTPARQVRPKKRPGRARTKS